MEKNFLIQYMIFIGKNEQKITGCQGTKSISFMK